MNVAFKHLEAKLRFGELSIGQWAGVLGGVLFALRLRAVPEPGRRAAGGRARRLPRRDPGQRGVLRQPERVRPVGPAGRRGALAAPARAATCPAAASTRPRLRAARRRADGARAARDAGPSSSERCGTDHRATSRDASVTRRRRRRSCREAGELVGVEAIDRTGAAGHQRRRVRARAAGDAAEPADPRRRGPPARSPPGFCHLIGRLRPGQSLQFYVDARPVRLDDLLADARARGRGRRRARAGRRAAGARRDRAVALAAVRGDGGVAAPARRRAGRRRAARLRRRSRTCRAAPRRARAGRPARAVLARPPLERGVGAHRRAVRESQAHVDALRAELEALGLPVRQLNGDAGASRCCGRG